MKVCFVGGPLDGEARDVELERIVGGYPEIPREYEHVHIPNVEAGPIPDPGDIPAAGPPFEIVRYQRIEMMIGTDGQHPYHAPTCPIGSHVWQELETWRWHVYVAPGALEDPKYAHLFGGDPGE